MFSQRHYEFIANILRVQSTSSKLGVDLQELIDDLCTEFKRDNANFNKDRFLKVCDL